MKPNQVIKVQRQAERMDFQKILGVPADKDVVVLDNGAKEDSENFHVLICVRVTFLEQFSRSDGLYLGSVVLDESWGWVGIPYYNDTGDGYIRYSRGGSFSNAIGGWRFRIYTPLNGDIESIEHQVQQAREFLADKNAIRINAYYL